MFGRSTSKIYGLALLASGQSNTMTTSYSGQYIMQVTYNNGWIVSSLYCAHQDTFTYTLYYINSYIIYIYQEKIKKKVKSLYAWILEAVDLRESPSIFFLNDN